MASSLGNTHHSSKHREQTRGRGGRGRRKPKGLGRHKDTSNSSWHDLIVKRARSRAGGGCEGVKKRQSRERRRKSATSTHAVTKWLQRGTVKLKNTPGRNSTRWSKEVQRERREKGIGGEKNSWSYSIWQLVDRFKPAMPVSDYVLEPEAVRHTDYSLTHPQRNVLCFVIDKSPPGTVYAPPQCF